MVVMKLPLTPSTPLQTPPDILISFTDSAKYPDKLLAEFLKLNNSIVP